ncbi:MAG TPA: GUN4 N-terminal ARM-like repeat domain-containing protein, partial [Candidatus Caenarcaniphilales bacterium]
MTESIDNPPTSKDDTQPQNLPDLRAQLTVGSEKVQLKAIQELSRFGEEGLAVLMDFLLKRWQSSSVNFVDGIAYQTLLKADDPEVVKFLHNNFPVGVVALHSERGLDYKPLQKRLAEQQFQAADQLTRQIMCQLAGSAAAQRQWLYFTEVDS